MYSEAIPSRYQRRCLIGLFSCGLVAIFYFGLMAQFPTPAEPILYIRNDHLLHVCAFGFLSLVGPAALGADGDSAPSAFCRSLVWRRWAPMAMMVAALIAVGGVLEIAQMAVPSRETSWIDWGASSTGVVLGAFLFVMVRSFVMLVSEAKP